MFPLTMASALIALALAPSVAPATSLCAISLAPQASSVQAVAAVSATDAMAVGGYYVHLPVVPVAMRWNGSTWTNTTTVSNQDFTRNAFESVAAIPGTNNYWAVGLSWNATGPNYTLIENWDGSKWSIGRVEQGWLNGVSASSTTDAWAVGYATTVANVDKPLTLHWDGTRWSRIVPPLPPKFGYGILTAVVDYGTSDVWTVGFYYSTLGSTAYDLIEHWDGSAWNIVDTQDTGGLIPLAAVPNSNVLWSATVGNPSSTFERWDGKKWGAAPGALGQIQSISATAQNEIWAVGRRFNKRNRMLPLVERSDGSKWQAVSSKNPNSHADAFLSGVSPNFVAGGVWITGYSNNLTFIESCT